MLKYILPAAAALSLVFAGAASDANAASKHKRHRTMHKSSMSQETRPNPTNSSPVGTPGNGTPSKYTGGR